MFGNSAPSGLSFTKILSGISKTLNVANQVIPLYQQAKPMINNAKTIMSALKDFTTKSKNNTDISSISEPKNEEALTHKFTNNLPTFFQ